MPIGKASVRFRTLRQKILFVPVYSLHVEGINFRPNRPSIRGEWLNFNKIKERGGEGGI